MAKNRRMVYSIIFAIIGSLLVCIDITTTVPRDASVQVFGYKYNGLLNFSSQLIYPFTKINVINLLCISVTFYFLLKFSREKSISLNRFQYKSILQSILNVSIAFIAAIYFDFGCLYNFNLVERNFYSPVYLILTMLNVGGLTLLLSLLFRNIEQTIYIYMDKIKPSSSTSMIKSFDFKKSYLFILAGWIPYMIIFYPGLWSWDTINQFFEYFGYGQIVRDVYPIGWYLVKSNPFSITNQHNFLVTLFYGFNLKIGLKLFNSLQFGIFLSAFIQSIFQILIITYFLSTLDKMRMKIKNVNIIKYLFTFFPLFPIYSLYLVKNVIFSSFLLLFVIQMAWVIYDARVIHTLKWKIITFLSVLGMLFTQKYAFYIILIMIIVVFFITKKEKLKRLEFILISSLIFFTLFEGILFSLLRVPKGDPIEGKAVMIQQTALYVKEHPHSLTKQQYKELNKIFVVKNLGKLYNPELADPVKSSGYKDNNTLEGYRYKTVSKTDIDKYNTIWIQLFLRDPRLFVIAFMNQSFRYLDLTPTRYNSSINEQTNSIPLSHESFTIKIEEKEFKYHDTDNSFMLKIRKIISLLYNVIAKIWPMSMVLNGSLIIWSYLVITILVLIGKTSYKYLLMLFPVIIQIPILLLSPSNGSQRYSYPLLFLFLPVMCLIFQIIVNKKESRNE